MLAHESEESRNLVLGKLALDSGLITPEQLRDSLSIQAKAFEIGLEEELLEILVKKRFIGTEQAESLKKALADRERWLSLEKVVASEAADKGFVDREAALGSVAGLGPAKEQKAFEQVLFEEGRIDEETLTKIRTLRAALEAGEGETLADERPLHPDPANAQGGLLDALTAGTVLVDDEGKPLPVPSLPGLGSRPRSEAQGRVLGDYEIVREIGRGAMGVVYEAQQRSLKRKVALKVLPPEMVMNEQRVRRFQREAEAAARLDHPGIVKVYGCGDDDGIHYFAMQFVTGQDLDEKASDSRLAVRSAVKIIREAAEALEYAHSQGVIHRDIKPANVMITEAGKVMIMDFGLARAEGGEASLTASGAIMGTPAFMSPEQARGDRRAVSALSDVYGLGCTLYFLVTGTTPHDIDDAVGLHGVLQHIVSHEPVPPRRRERSVPAPVETIILKAMAMDPARRYGSAQALADDLGRFLSGEPIRARATTLVEKSLWKMRRRIWAVLAVIVIASSLGALYPIFLAGREGARAEEPRKKLSQARKALKAGDASKSLALASYVLKNFPRSGLSVQAQRLVAESSEDGDRTVFLNACAVLWAMDRNGPDGAWARVRLGQHLLETEQFTGAASLVEDLQSQEDPAVTAGARLVLARSSYSRHDYNQAAEFYEMLWKGGRDHLSEDAREETATRRRLLRFFTPTLTLDLPAASLAVGDVTGEGRPDLVIVHRSTLRVLTREGRSLKRVVEHSMDNLGMNSLQAVCVADFNGDGRQEIALTLGRDATRVEPGTEGRLVVCHVEKGVLKEDWTHPLTSVVRPHSLVAADIDGDGRPELAVGLSFYMRRLLCFEYEGGRYGEYGQVFLPEPRRRSDVECLAAGDVDGDGCEELALAVGPWNGYGLYLLEQALAGRKPYVMAGGFFDLGKVSWATAGDFSGNGRAEIALGKMHTVNEVFYGEGKPRGPVRAHDLVVLAYGPNGLVERGGEDFAPNRLGLGVLALASADLTGNGREEIVALAQVEPEGSTVRQEVSALRLKEEGGLHKVVLFTPRGQAQQFRSMFSGDVDGDGKEEILLAGGKILILGFN